MYQKVKDGLQYDQQTGRVWNHQGYARSIHWNPAMLGYLKRNYATTLNDELAEWLGVSLRTVIRKAREIGLEKDPVWLAAIWEERRRMAHFESRRKGYPGGFKKGERANPDGEFKKGHKESEETRLKRSESMKRWYRQHPGAAKEKAQKAWATRRKQ